MNSRNDIIIYERPPLRIIIYQPRITAYIATCTHTKTKSFNFARLVDQQHATYTKRSASNNNQIPIQSQPINWYEVNILFLGNISGFNHQFPHKLYMKPLFLWHFVACFIGPLGCGWNLGTNTLLAARDLFQRLKGAVDWRRNSPWVDQLLLIALTAIGDQPIELIN